MQGWAISSYKGSRTERAIPPPINRIYPQRAHIRLSRIHAFRLSMSNASASQYPTLHARDSEAALAALELIDDAAAIEK
jgi:hypothetical protein